MNKILMIAVVGLLLVGSVSAYGCIYKNDNEAVKDFKMKLNSISLQQDVNNGLSEEAIIIKLKYFGPCK